MTVQESMDIIRKHQHDAPVQMVSLAHALGIIVYKVSGWPDEISGRIYRSIEKGGDRGLVIEVNASHPEVRRRFTIAHEIAHSILHPSHIGYISSLVGDNALYDDAMYRSGLTNAQEVQANNLAAKILVPDHLLRNYGPLLSWDTQRLAERFNVSEAMMQIRLGTFA